MTFSYKNTTQFAKTIYGIEFLPGEVHEVPGYINVPGFILTNAPPDPVYPPDEEIVSNHTHANKRILDAITASYTSNEQVKLSNIEARAQVNVIDNITVNGVAVDPVNKSIDVTIPNADWTEATAEDIDALCNT